MSVRAALVTLVEATVAPDDVDGPAGPGRRPVGEPGCAKHLANPDNAGQNKLQ